MQKKVFILGGCLIGLFLLSLNGVNIKKESSDVVDVETQISFIDYEETEIKDILDTDELYAELPEAAKDYVATIYEETGEILKTEKNKDGGPYLNPTYVAYLSLDAETQQKQEVVPVATTIDYVYDGEVEGTNYGSQFSLLNVNGVSRISNLRDQGNLGICWAFAAAEQAESNIYIKNNINTNTSTHMLFSARQLDYALSSNGVLNFDNSINRAFYSRQLTEAATVIDAPFVFSNGIAAVSTSIFQDNYITSQKTLSSVFNYENSQYEIDKFELFPEFTFRDEATISNATEKAQYLAEKKAYLDSIKTAIVEEGGVAVATQSPQYTCASSNSATGYTGTRIIRVDNKCIQDAGHAMQIIGWDDNYRYTYTTCNGHNTIEDKTVVGHKNEYMTCSSNVTTESGTGAWILRNSWGNFGNGYDYVYLAYDSLGLGSAMVTMSDFKSMRKVEDGGERKWDNNYHESIVSTGAYVNNSSVSVSVPADRYEKIEKIKFHAYYGSGYPKTYNFYFKVGTDDMYYIMIDSNTKLSATASYNGLMTVDVSSYNIAINDTITEIGVIGGGYVLDGSVAVFTSNISNDAEIFMPDATINLTSGSYLSNTIYSVTRGLDSGTQITYKLYDEKENDRTADYNLSFDDNKISTNNINSKFSSNVLADGVYALEAKYILNNSVVASDFELVKVGSGNVTIAYNVNGGGTINASSSITINAITGTASTVTATPNAYYEFKKWVDNNGNTVTTDSVLTPALQKNRFGFYFTHTYTAVFEIKKYTVSFYTRGGSLVENVEVNYGGKITRPSDPTYAGKDFEGWYKENECVNEWDFDNDVVTNDMILYAKWSSPDVEFDAGDLNYKENDGIIDDVIEKTKAVNFKNKLSVSSSYWIKMFDKNNIELGNNDLVGTGSTIRIYDLGGNLTKMVVNVIRGDVSGDGKISASDYVLIKNYIMGRNSLSGVYYTAADFDKSGTVKATDYVKIKNKIMQ